MQEYWYNAINQCKAEAKRRVCTRWSCPPEAIYPLCPPPNWQRHISNLADYPSGIYIKGKYTLLPIKTLLKKIEN